MTTLEEIGSRTLRAVATLEKDFQKRVRAWLNEMITTGIQPLVYCGFRSLEEQAALYAQGRGGRPGKIVTNARLGESYHNYGLAFDWVPVRATPKNKNLFEADWDDSTAYKMGIQCGHTFNFVEVSWETGHLQDGRYKTWRDIPGSSSTPPVSNKPRPKTGGVTLRKTR